MTRKAFKIFRPGVREVTDSGLSNVVGSQSNRLLNTDGSFNIERTGIPRFSDYSIIHELMTMSWRRFLFLVFAAYVGMNLVFGSVYYLIGMNQFMGAIASTPGEQFLEAFFFSAQTLATVGYGRMNPVGLSANLVSGFESMIGLIVIAIITGLVYGRFSRPVIRLMFSKNALIAPFKGGKALMFRIANAKRNDLSDVEAQVLMSCVLYEDGRYIRRYFGLDLERKRVGALSLSWTVVHPIDENSPLANFDAQLLEEYEAEILVVIKGFDPTFSQTVQARSSYHHRHIVWNARFKPTFRRSDDGHRTLLELDRLNDHEPAPTPEPEKKTL